MSIVVFLLLAGIAMVWVAGWFLTKPVPASFNNLPDGVKAVHFESASGSDIQGWLFPATKPKASAVLMHGIRSNRGQMVDRAEHLRSMGISTLIFDFQAHGESEGSIITLGHLESLDAQAAVSLMRESAPELPIVVFGVSMGGAAFLLARPTIEVEALILESVYSDIETAISNRLSSRLPGGELLTPLLAGQIKLRTGIAAASLSPVNEARRVVAATLVMSGDEDTKTSVVDTQLLFDSLPEPKQLALIKGAGHVDLEQHNVASYWAVVEPFLEQHLQ